MSLRPQENPGNPVALHRTIAALLDHIAEALNEGATVAPHSIDSSGLSIAVDGRYLRLEITEDDAPVPDWEDDAPEDASEEPAEDAAEWHAIHAARFDRFLEQRSQPEADRDWMSDQGDDIEF